MTASQELSKRLYELSGWGDTPWLYGGLMKHSVRFDDDIYTRAEMETADGFAIHEDHPAYDAGYLLRKLPEFSDTQKTDIGYAASFKEDNGAGKYHYCKGATPEDALSKLCITLFEAGILSKEEL